MKLAAWLNLPNPDGTKKRRKEFAARVGVTPTMITEYCKEINPMWPSKERMEAIVRETNGDVTANDFISMESAATEAAA